MRQLARLAAIAVIGLCASSAAWAQWSNVPPRAGACFYVDFNFRGESFCMNAGQDAAVLPEGFGDRIRSIRVFGGAQVTYFNDSQFRGASGTTSSDIPDLRRLPLPDVPWKNWAVRISSVRIANTGWQGRREDWDRDHDRDRNQDNDWRRRDRDSRTWYSNDSIAAVICSSDARRGREWCRTPGGIHSVRLVDETGSQQCEWNRTFGIDNGRLWTSDGCGGNFEVR